MIQHYLKLKQKTPRWMIYMGPCPICRPCHGQIFGQDAWLLRNESRVRQCVDMTLTLTYCGLSVGHVMFCRRTRLFANRASFNALLTKPILTRLHFVAFVAPSSRSLFPKIYISPNVSPYFYFIFLFNHLVLSCSFYTHQICYLNL